MSTAQTVHAAEPGILKLTFIMAAMTTVAGIVLGGLAYFTIPIAIKNNIERERKARQAILPAAASFQEMGVEHGWYEGKSVSDELVGYVLQTSERGYGGSIRISLGVDKDLKIITYKITGHNETPGLGDKAKKPKFKDQFKDRSMDQLKLTKRKEAGKINAITGATITSKAVVKAIEKALVKLDEHQNPPPAVKPQGGTHQEVTP